MSKDLFWRASYLDASATVKLVVQEQEPGWENLRAYFNGRDGFFITGLCLAEALGVLKRKWLGNVITKDKYFAACYMLLAYVRGGIVVEEFVPPQMEAFNKIEELGRRYDLDLSDALQLVSIKFGNFRRGFQESQSILITADAPLANAARMEGLKVWNCRETKFPSD